MKSTTRRRFLKTAGVTAALAAGGFAFSRWDTDEIECHAQTLDLSGWHGPSLTIGFLSDTHLWNDEAVARTKRACQYLLDAKPDAILFGGDFVEATVPDSIERIAPAFRDLRHFKGPKLAVLGNHDYAIPHPNRVQSEAEKVGFHVLQNESVTIGNATLVGLDCMSFHRGKVDMLSEFSSDQNVICAVHEPDTVVQIDPGLASVTLAGHSHGGQVCLPGGIAIHTPPMAKKYVSGYYSDASTPLYVSRGLGVTEVPFRMFCRPEATLLTLKESHS